jgi:outer membrane protein assembly factor BamA
MTGLRSLVLCLLTGVLCHASAAWRTDSLPDWPVMGVPVINHAPETDWVFGAAVQGWFRLSGQERTSWVQLDGAWSVKNQWYINTSGTIFCGRKTAWQIAWNLGYRDYPDTWFPRGNAPQPKNGLSYSSRRWRAGVQPLYRLPRHWAVGPEIACLFERTSVSPEVAYMAVGLVVQYDSRDVLFYPRHGLLFKLTAADWESLNAAFSRAGVVKADLRHFIPLPADMVLAWQFRTEWTFGASVPFQLLPALGGQDLLRGVRTGMFRDNALWALQGEWRFPLWSILRGAVFAGAGDVYQFGNWNWAMPKVGYGIGLRLCINRAKVNVRFDLARSNIRREWNTWESYSFYLTATEAF